MGYNFFIPLLFLSLCDESVLVVARLDGRSILEEQEKQRESDKRAVAVHKMNPPTNPTTGKFFTAMSWKMRIALVATIVAMIAAVTLLILIHEGKRQVDAAQDKAINNPEKGIRMKADKVLEYNKIVATKVGKITGNMDKYIGGTRDSLDRFNGAFSDNGDFYRQKVVEDEDWFRDQSALHKYGMKYLDTRYTTTESKLAYFYKKIQKRFKNMQEASDLDQLKHFEWAENACVSLEQKSNRIKKSIKSEGNAAAAAWKNFDKQFQVMAKSQNMMDFKTANIEWTQFSEGMKNAWKLAWDARKRYRTLKKTMVKDYVEMMNLFAKTKQSNNKFEQRLKSPGPYLGLLAKAKEISKNRNKFFEDRAIKVEKEKEGLDRMGDFTRIYIQEMLATTKENMKAAMKDSDDEQKSQWNELGAGLEGARETFGKTGEAVLQYVNQAQSKLKGFPDFSSAFKGQIEGIGPEIVSAWGQKNGELNANARSTNLGNAKLLKKSITAGEKIIDGGSEKIGETLGLYHDEQKDMGGDARQQLSDMAKGQEYAQVVFGEHIPKEEKLLERQQEALYKAEDRATISVERLKEGVADTMAQSHLLSGDSSKDLFDAMVTDGKDRLTEQWNGQENAARTMGSTYKSDMNRIRVEEKVEAGDLSQEIGRMSTQISKSREKVKKGDDDMNNEILGIDEKVPVMRATSDEVSREILSDQEAFSANAISLDGALKHIETQAVRQGIQRAGGSVVKTGKGLEKILFKLVTHVGEVIENTEPELSKMQHIQDKTVGDATKQVGVLQTEAADLKSKLTGTMVVVTDDVSQTSKKLNAVVKVIQTDKKDVTSSVGEDFKEAEKAFEHSVEQRELKSQASRAANSALAALKMSIASVLRSNPADKSYVGNLGDVMAKAGAVAAKLDQNSGNRELNMESVVSRVSSVLAGTNDAITAAQRAANDGLNGADSSLYNPNSTLHLDTDISRLNDATNSETEKLASQLKLAGTTEGNAMNAAGGQLSSQTGKLQGMTDKALSEVLAEQEKTDARNQKLHSVIDSLGGVLDNESLEMLRHPALEQDRLIEGYDAIKMDINELFAQIKMMKEALDKAGYDTSGYDDAVAKHGLNGAVVSLTGVEADANAVGNAINNAAKAEQNAQGQLDGDVNSAKNLASQEEAALRAAMANGFTGAGRLLHLLSDEEQEQIATATAQIRGVSKELSKAVASLPDLQRIFVKQADVTKEIDAYKQHADQSTRGDAARVNAVLSGVESDERKNKALEQQLEDQQNAALSAAGHQNLPTLTISVPGMTDVENVVSGGIANNKNTQDGIMASKVEKNDENLANAISDDTKYRDELHDDFAAESSIANQVVADERATAMESMRAAAAEQGSTGEILAGLETRTGDLKLNVQKLYSTAEHFNMQAGIKETTQFQAQEQEIKDLAKSLKYYGITYGGSLSEVDSEESTEAGDADSDDGEDLDSIEQTLRNEDRESNTRASIQKVKTGQKGLLKLLR